MSCGPVRDIACGAFSVTCKPFELTRIMLLCKYQMSAKGSETGETLVHGVCVSTPQHTLVHPIYAYAHRVGVRISGV